MASTQPNLIITAKQGDPKAIAALMNRSLNPKGVTVKAFLQKQRLNIFLESVKVPPQHTLMAFTRKGIENLRLQTVQTVRVHGRQEGSDLASWVEEFKLDTYQDPVTDDQTLERNAIVVAASTALSHEAKMNTSHPNNPAVVKPTVLSWVVLSAGVGALVLILGSLGGAIAWLRYTQIQALNQVADLTQSVNQSDTPKDIDTLRIDQSQLKQAIDSLEETPTFPLVNVAALTTEISTLQEQLTQVNADIALYETLLPKIQNVLDRFSHLDSGLEVSIGINYHNYFDYEGKVEQLNTSIERLGREPNIENYAVYIDLQEAYEDYEFAHSVWKYYMDNGNYFFFPATSSYGRTLVSTYNVETSNIRGRQMIYVRTALSAVWQSANVKIKSAQEKL